MSKASNQNKSSDNKDEDIIDADIDWL
jgi:hypothetical protein